MSDLVLYDVKDRVATITLNRPERRNAQNPELLDLLNDCWERAAFRCARAVRAASGSCSCPE